MLFGIAASWLILSNPSLPAKHSDSSDSRVIARVGSHSITLREAEREVALPLYQLDQQRSQLLHYSVQQLIDAELLQTEAKRMGKTVEELLESNADAQTSSQRQQPLIVALRRNTSIEILLPPVAEPVVTVPTDDDPSIGSPTAPVTIVEFSDFQCPYCKASVAVLKKVLRDYGDKVRLVYRDYPGPSHVYAEPAAEAAACAAAQGKFWEYHDLLFEQQYPGIGWDFVQLAQQSSLDVRAFSRCLHTHHYAEEIKGDLHDALKLGVTSTPTFFVNGRPLVGARSVEEFKFLIDKAISNTNQS